MENLIKETRKAIDEFNSLKAKYPRIATIDVIKMLERLENDLKLILNSSSLQLNEKEIETFSIWIINNCEPKEYFMYEYKEEVYYLSGLYHKYKTEIT